ncbi:hypothetical protein C8Q74DRAFT_630979 [Fomes fomentarius]|nr:hypothetical protein C8Q74DRAFT_630979 [Fomes fomentarius]
MIGVIRKLQPLGHSPESTVKGAHRVLVATEAPRTRTCPRSEERQPTRDATTTRLERGPQMAEAPVPALRCRTSPPPPPIGLPSIRLPRGDRCSPLSAWVSIVRVRIAKMKMHPTATAHPHSLSNARSGACDSVIMKLAWVDDSCYWERMCPPTTSAVDIVRRGKGAMVNRHTRPTMTRAKASTVSDGSVMRCVSCWRSSPLSTSRSGDASSSSAIEEGVAIFSSPGLSKRASGGGARWEDESLAVSTVMRCVMVSVAEYKGSTFSVGCRHSR